MGRGDDLPDEGLGGADDPDLDGESIDGLGFDPTGGSGTGPFGDDQSWDGERWIDPRPAIEGPRILTVPTDGTYLPVINVKERPYNAQGNADEDPDSNDTQAIRDAIEAAPEGGAIIYFPAGVYRLGLEDELIRVENKSCLTFLGEGDCSVILRAAIGFRRTEVGADSGGGGIELPHDSVPGILDFADCAGITITKLAFDANGFEPVDSRIGTFAPSTPERNGRALVTFARCSRIRIVATHCYDSHPRRRTELDQDSIARLAEPPLDVHHLAYAVEHGYETRFRDNGTAVGEVADATNFDILIQDNLLESLGVLVRNAAHVRILDNDIRRPIPTAIVLGGRPGNSHIRDVVVAGNTIVDPGVYGIRAMDWNLQNSAPSRSQSQMRRVRIADNDIMKQEDEFTHPFGAGIFVGTNPGDDRGQDSNDIMIEGNLVHIQRHSEKSWGIRLFHAEAPAGVQSPRFVRAKIVDNTIVAVPDVTGIDAVGLRRGVVAGNRVFVGGAGIRLDRPSRIYVHDNWVEAEGVAYGLEHSQGRNVFADDVEGSSEVADLAARWVVDEVVDTDRFRGPDRRRHP